VKEKRENWKSVKRVKDWNMGEESPVSRGRVRSIIAKKTLLDRKKEEEIFRKNREKKKEAATTARDCSKANITGTSMDLWRGKREERQEGLSRIGERGREEPSIYGQSPTEIQGKVKLRGNKRGKST